MKITSRLSRSKRPSRHSSRRRLELETLENRCLLTAVAAPSNLVSWWSAQNSGVDVAGLNNASLSNGATYAGGKVGQSFSFDGVNDRAQLGDPESLKFTASMSIEGWVLVRAYPSTTNFGTILFRGDDRGGLDPYSLVVQPDGQLRFEVDGGQGAADVLAPVPLGQFIHVAATLDDATGAMKLYENGAVVAQMVTPIRPFHDLDPTLHPGIGIGNANSTYNVPFNGLIDELAVYNRALCRNEVLGIYEAGSSGKVISPIVVDGPSVVEGAAGTTTPVTFTIQRTGSLSGSLTVGWTTADDTASSASDYVAAAGSVTFADGQATQTVQVIVNGDNTPESDETLKLILTPAGGTPIMGLGTVVNDDASISIANAVATEGSVALKVLDRFVSDGSGGLAKSKGSTFGPDGNFYVASSDTNAILRYDGATGAFMDAFVPSGSGGLNGPVDVVFGPDGNLYVSSYFTNQVLRYDGSSGAFLDGVVSGLSTPIGITFGPDGSLYIANQGTNEVLRYNDSGLSVFVTAGSGGLSQTRKAVFGPDGNLYVAGQGTGKVLRYNGQTGALIDTFATTGSTQGPLWLEFGNDGYLYTSARTTSSGTNTSIMRFNGATGSFVDSFAIGRDGWSFNIGPGNIVYSSANSAGGFVDRIGPSSIATFTVSLSSASAGETTVNYSTADGTAMAGSDYLPVSGTLTFAAGETTKSILVSTIDDSILEPTETFTVNLFNATGGVITNGEGVGTVLDNEVPPTKFYVVNDGSPDRTFEYGTTGSSVENYAINSGNSVPRGAASTAAGDKVWVVDTNKNVYVYNTSGGLLGSWSAGSLNSKADVQGITTNGTDIWLVDAKQDAVYKYTGAASRLSGSQNTASSFSLNSSNTGPKDLVTDGTSIWVVNDSSTDKVFKYNLSGSLQGSWTINSGGGSPTGITLDPNPSQIGNSLWIVDSATDRVYEFASAGGVTSGSLSPTGNFALTSGNTNPQGIADPPVEGEPAHLVVDEDFPHEGTVFPSPLAGFQSNSGLSGQTATNLAGDEERADIDSSIAFAEIFRPEPVDVNTILDSASESVASSENHDLALSFVSDELDSLKLLSSFRRTP